MAISRFFLVLTAPILGAIGGLAAGFLTGYAAGLKTVGQEQSSEAIPPDL